MAIACQGGGSHAAFCAGALKVLLTGQTDGDYRVTGSAAVPRAARSAPPWRWYGMAAGGADVERRGARRGAAAATASGATTPRRAVVGEVVERGAAARGAIAPFEPKWSPYAIPVQEMLDLAATVRERLGLAGPRREFVDLAALLEKHAPGLDRVEFGDVLLLLRCGGRRLRCLQGLQLPARARYPRTRCSPRRRCPTLFRAMRIDGRAYWDGPVLAESAAAQLRRRRRNRRTTSRTRSGCCRSIRSARRRSRGRRGTSRTAATSWPATCRSTRSCEFIRTVNRWLAEGTAGGRQDARSRQPQAGRRLSDRHGQRGASASAWAISTSRPSWTAAPSLIAALMAQGEVQARLFLPVRRFLSGVWCEADPKARARRAPSRLFAGGRAQRMPELQALHDAYRTFLVAVDDLQIRGESAGPRRRGSALARQRHQPRGRRRWRRAGRASFMVAEGTLREIGITADG
ncbi:MAG: hypothetical protein MZW92_22070 [Comamonadaceae bacterium]|nr:hypothetical protein [Comamonadaceae bacterium]